MKFNLLYILIPAAIGTCVYITKNLQSNSVHTFFGTAETEPTVINIDLDVRVQNLLVRSGQEVKAGDTIAILQHSKLEEEAFTLTTDLNRTGVEYSGTKALIQAQKQTLDAAFRVKSAEIIQEIAIINTSDSLQQAVNGRLFPGVHGTNEVSQRKIAALNEALAKEQQKHQKELEQLNIEAKAEANNTAVKQSITQQKQGRQLASRAKLVLIAPVSGYIDQLNIQVGSLVPAYRDMLRIYPTSANKVIGFVHENAPIPFRIGEEVTLSSATRPTETAQGKIIAVSPKLVELPLRLRKFIEVRSWGRELIIQPTTNNTYYIGEKISITLKDTVQ